MKQLTDTQLENGNIFVCGDVSSHNEQY